MPALDDLEFLFVVFAFIYQFTLIFHFALRKWCFALAIRFGPIVYALSVLAVVISVVILLGDKPWPLWVGGFIYFIWGVFGYWIEYIKKIKWRNPIRWSIYGPYLFLYLATIMFYWWPLALIWKPLWYVYTVLFIISTILNVTSHQGNINDDRLPG